MIRCETVVIDRRRQVVTLDGHELDLTPTEFALLDALLRHPGRAFRRSDLIDAAVGDGTIVLERTIDVHIRSLRRKLGPHADLNQTVRGIGYRCREARLERPDTSAGRRRSPRPPLFGAGLPVC